MSYRLLLIDDYADQRTLLREAFARNELFEVVGEAGTAEEAAVAAKESEPDIILLDLKLAGQDGLELLPRLREWAPGAQIVVLSGLPREEFEFAVRAGGAVGYLEKGLSPIALPDALLAIAGILDIVAEALERSSASLRHHPSSPGVARRFVADVLRKWRCEDLLQTVELAVSELVTNALIHARTPVDVTVSLRERDVRVDVVDRGSGKPQIRASEEAADSGRGLLIVQSLATSWGVREGPGWKSVWFLVPRPDVAAPSPSAANPD